MKQTYVTLDNGNTYKIESTSSAGMGHLNRFITGRGPSPERFVKLARESVALTCTRIYPVLSSRATYHKPTGTLSIYLSDLEREEVPNDTLFVKSAKTGNIVEFHATGEKDMDESGEDVYGEYFRNNTVTRVKVLLIND